MDKPAQVRTISAHKVNYFWTYWVILDVPKLLFGARGGTRTRTILRSRDFKSLAYAIPPPGLGQICVAGQCTYQ